VEPPSRSTRIARRGPLTSGSHRLLSGTATTGLDLGALPADADGVAPIDDPAGLLPLDRTQLDALREHLDAVIAAGGCDRTHRATDAWAAGHGIALDRLHEGLEEFGGFCDCEVVMNVDPGVVFEEAAQVAARVACQAAAQAASGPAAAGPSAR
jgi:hypothetical protein